MANMIQNAAASTQAVAKSKKPSSIQDYIEVMKPAIQAALPSVMTPERFSRITLSALSANPKLKECTPPVFPWRYDDRRTVGLGAEYPSWAGLPDSLPQSRPDGVPIPAWL